MLSLQKLSSLGYSLLQFVMSQFQTGQELGYRDFDSSSMEADSHAVQTQELVARHSLLCCRAAVHLKLRNPEAALKDAECAVELDPQYAKAFLRRASAHQALEHYEEAVKDFEQVIS